MADHGHPHFEEIPMGGRRISQAERDQWVRMYRCGLNMGQIISQTGRCYPTIRTALKRQGVDLKSRSELRRTRTLDEGVFDLDTPESRYWIGFLLADGYVSKPPAHHITIRLAELDVGHVERFKRFLKTDTPIRYQVGGYRGSGRTADITVSSERMVTRLATLGVSCQKTWTAHTPPALANDRDFWRGAIDGDGWLWFKRKQKKHFAWDIELGLCGTADVCEGFSQYLRKSLGSPVRGGRYAVRKNNTIWKVTASGYRALAAAELLYSEPCVSLDRKQQLAESFAALAANL